MDSQVLQGESLIPIIQWLSCHDLTENHNAIVIFTLEVGLG